MKGVDALATVIGLQARRSMNSRLKQCCFDQNRFVALSRCFVRFRMAVDGREPSTRHFARERFRAHGRVFRRGQGGLTVKPAAIGRESGLLRDFN